MRHHNSGLFSPFSLTRTPVMKGSLGPSDLWWCFCPGQPAIVSH